VLLLLNCAVICLLFYAAMALGYSFARHKSLLSVVFFFALQFATQFLMSVFTFGLEGFKINCNLNTIAAIHTAMWIGIAGSLVYGAIYYLITTLMLKKHLNLE
jgi:hypothetical protein